MAAEMRAMLDQLMGAERDVPLEQRVNRKKLFTVRELNLVFSREKLQRGADDHGKCVFSLSLLLLLLLLLSLTPARVAVVPFHSFTLYRTRTWTNTSSAAWT
jgi:hypothetical protein